MRSCSFPSASRTSRSGHKLAEPVSAAIAHSELMRRLPYICVASLVMAAGLAAVTLRAETAAAFDRYVTLTEQRIGREVADNGHFLWIDSLSASKRAEMEVGLRGGGVVIERLTTRDGSRSIDAPGALIHHWVGLVFVPGVRLASAVALMQDYDRHAQVFAPNIAASRTLDHADS